MKNTKQGKSDKIANSALNHTLAKEKEEKEKEKNHNQGQDISRSLPPPISYSDFTVPISAMVDKSTPNLLNTAILPTAIILEYYSKYFKFSSKVPSPYALSQVYNHICRIRPPTYWNTLRTLKLQNQKLTELHDLDKILPLLENLVL